MHLSGYGAKSSMLQQLQLPTHKCEQITIEARCAFRGKNTHRLRRWRLTWDSPDSTFSRWAELQCDMANIVDGVDNPKSSLIIGENTHGNDSITHRTEIASGIDTDGGFNSILVEWNDGRARFFAGARGLQFVCEIPADTEPHGRCGITSNDNIEIQNLLMESIPQKSTPLLTGMTPEQINELATEQPNKPTGIWEYLDRENDPAKARPGGRYTLAVIETVQDGVYNIIYMGGAQVNAPRWQHGMLKGTLRATPFEGHYVMTWYDAMMEPIEHDLHADMTNRALLALHFPLMQTIMRFCRKL